MLVGFLDKVSGFFDRRFMVAFWAPFFLFSICGIGIIAVANGGLAGYVAEWDAQDASMQALLALGYILFVSAGAYLLQAFASSTIRLYEGYWPRWLKFLIRWGQKSIERTVQSTVTRNNREKVSSPTEDLIWRQRTYRRYIFFPYRPVRVRATRLGNVLATAEEYAYEIYNLDTVLWWPRLVPLLPEAMKIQIDSSLTPMLALLNLTTLMSILTAMALALGIFKLNLVVFIGGGVVFLALAWICYEAAVLQASEYGQQIRVAIDLYRTEILRQMRLPIPDSLPEEGALWSSLNTWIYEFVPPSETEWPPKEQDLVGGFRYASRAPDTDPSPSSEQSRKARVRRPQRGK